MGLQVQATQGRGLCGATGWKQGEVYIASMLRLHLIRWSQWGASAGGGGGGFWV
jgi:hypothetical protein